MTTFSNKLVILADLWLNYKQDEELADFIEYNDIGLPLAYLIHNEIVKTTDVAQKFVEETFELLLAKLEITDDGFEDLEDLLAN